MKFKHVLFAVLLASQPFVGNMVLAEESVAATPASPQPRPKATNSISTQLQPNSSWNSRA